VDPWPPDEARKGRMRKSILASARLRPVRHRLSADHAHRARHSEDGPRKLTLRHSEGLCMSGCYSGR
jgi:hypothetical protein